jgi:pentatricopeptide repeat protein
MYALWRCYRAVRRHFQAIVLRPLSSHAAGRRYCRTSLKCVRLLATVRIVYMLAAYDYLVLYCTDRSMSKALGLLAVMRKAGVKPDLRTYSSLISACAKNKAWERAIEVYHTK